MWEFFSASMKANLIAWGMTTIWVSCSAALAYFICKKPREFQLVLVLIMAITFLAFVSGVEFTDSMKGKYRV